MSAAVSEIVPAAPPADTAQCTRYNEMNLDTLLPRHRILGWGSGSPEVVGFSAGTAHGLYESRTQQEVASFHSVQFSSVAQSCPTLCDPMNHSTPGLPVHHQLPEFTQTHVHRVGDAI